MHTADITIRGLKLQVTYVVYPSEPDVGIMHPYPEVGEVRVYNKFHTAFPAEWFVKSMTPAEWDQLTDALPCEAPERCY